MKKIVYWNFTLKILSLLVLLLHLFAYQAEAQTPIDYPLMSWDQWAVYKDSNFGDYRKSDSAYHSGIDLTLKGSIKDGVNKPVYAIADGQVFKVDERKLGWSVVLKHVSSDQQFTIPEHNSQEYQYKQEKVSTIYSVYIHIKPIDKLKKKITKPNVITVKKGEIIGYINEMPAGIVPHLHFEIRHPDAKQSTGGSMLSPNTNWSRSGDYLNMKILVESGARNPLEFLEANIQTPSTEGFLPLTKGTYWIYKDTRNIKLPTGKEKVDVSIVTIRIIDLKNFGNITVATTDLTTKYDDRDEIYRNYSFVVRVGSDKFYELEEEDGKELLRRLTNDKDSKIDDLIVDGINLFLDLPLDTGKRFGESDKEQKDRKGYSNWHLVESQDQIELKNVKGIRPFDKVTRYKIKMDGESLDFVPNIGPIQRIYSHGIVTLIEYGKPDVESKPTITKVDPAIDHPPAKVVVVSISPDPKNAPPEGVKVDNVDVTLNQKIDPNTVIIADETLMKKYEPFLFFHEEEVYKELFYPMNIDTYLNKCSLWYAPASGQNSKVKDEGTVDAELLANLAKTRKDNDKLYLKFVEKRSSLEMMLLQENWDYTQDALVEYLNSSSKYTYYFRQFIEPDYGYLVLQYWFFYAFNSWGAYPFGYNTHEGDWESITLFLHPVTQQPIYAGYSAHHDKGNKVMRRWNEIRKTGTHPMVFVALGSHANYFEPRFDILTEIFTGGVPETPGKVFSDRTNATGMIIGTLKMEGASDWHEWENRVILEDETHSLPDWAKFYKGKWGMDAILGRVGFDGPKFPSFESDNEKYYHPVTLIKFIVTFLRQMGT